MTGGHSEMPVPMSGRAARIVLAVAIGAFVAQGWFFTGAQLTWHEEIAHHALPPPLQLSIENGTATVEAVCAGGTWFEYTKDRPQLVLCAAGLAWPVLVTSYIGAVHYWPLQLLRPLHEGDPVALRRINLVVFGVSALLVLFALVERVGDPLRAAAAVAVAAVLPAVVLINSVLVESEILPPLLIACAALLVARRSDPGQPPRPLRAAAAGALVGLAVLANVKGAVIALPLIAFALFESPVLRRTSNRAWLSAGLAAGIAVLPLVVANLGDPQDRFGYEVGRRFAIAAARLDPRYFIAEVGNAVLFAADLPFYFDMASGGDGSLALSMLVIPAIAFIYAAVELLRAVRRLPHDRIAAGCGAVQIFYVVFVWLAYNQTPATNYGPVIYVQATGIGCMVIAAGRLAARWGRRPVVGIAVMGSLAFISLVGNLYRRGDPRDFEAISMNLTAVRELQAHLRSNPGGTVVVTSYNLAGVPDVITGEPSLRIDRALENCKDEPDVEACEREVLAAVIRVVPGARFLVPVRTGVVDKPSATRALTAVGAVARAMGLEAREEARFYTSRGVDVLALVAVVNDRRDPSA